MKPHIYNTFNRKVFILYSVYGYEHEKVNKMEYKTEMDLFDISLLKAIAKKYGKYTPSGLWELNVRYLDTPNEIIINEKNYEINKLMVEN